MPIITAIGETVLDIIIKDGKPLAANPGGSVLNTMVSLGRLGCRVRFITELGQDAPGMQVKDFLADNCVDAGCACIYPDRQTAIALAYLDTENNAHYTFYKDYPQQRLQIPVPVFEAGGYFLFASSMAINPQVRPIIIALAKQAASAGVTVYYDPNCRPKAGQDASVAKQLMLENMRMSHIVRGSDEDFAHIFGHDDLALIWREIQSPLLQMLICTHGADGVAVMRGGETFRFPVPQIQPVSTVGAGDNFNAGILFGLAKSGIGQDGIASIHAEALAQLCSTAAECSAHVCCSLDNYISKEFALNLSAR